MQKLYATGFNAWGQLNFDAEPNTEPDDVETFTHVLSANAITSIRPALSYTTVTTSDGNSKAGTSTVGDADRLAHFSEALNGQVVVYDKSDGGILLQYPSVADLLKEILECKCFLGFPDVVQVVAYDVGFAALSADGSVWTWGDARFPECLGRDAALKSADVPGLVAALKGLPTGPIVKLAAGGYVLAALTKGQDLYCWGGYPGRRPVVLEGLMGEPSPIVVSVTPDAASTGEVGEEDIVDVGVGDGHMIALTASGSVCVIGSNASGQLGLGRDWKSANDTDVSKSWIKVGGFSSDEGRQATSVYAGPRSSFVVVTEK
ncbi:hypothetical protein SCUCBS95973_005282 [Sporothrix curviconia]|uniref:Uncharacterized protein n=1 Tax=Sporothrix curviconia TaxID=1260050 RepID=A0ABP0BWH1_9PEZI